MEQRKGPRFATDQAVVVTVLGEKETRCPATVTNAGGRGLGLMASEPIPSGAAISIDFADDLLLGEVIYCRAGKGGWAVGVELQQQLSGLAQLRRLLREFECAPERESRAVS